MTEETEGPRVHRGLLGVHFERSPTTFIDGKAGDLRYRGYSIHDLAEHSTFEETGYLLMKGELPTAGELAAFVDDLKAGRTLPDAVLDIIRTIQDAHPMDVLRTAVSALAPYARHGVNVNVDFYSGVIYYLHGIPADLFVPIFAVGRVPGWTVQIMEQWANNILIRPLLKYDGPELRAYVPIGER